MNLLNHLGKHKPVFGNSKFSDVTLQSLNDFFDQISQYDMTFTHLSGNVYARPRRQNFKKINLLDQVIAAFAAMGFFFLGGIFLFSFFYPFLSIFFK